MHKKKLTVLIVAILMLTTTYPAISMRDSAHAAGEDLIVRAEILYLREGPGLSYPILETLKDGEPLQSLAKEGDWIQVRKGNQQGWVAAWLVKSASKKTAASTKKTIISQVNNLNLRAEPSLSAAVLTKISSGTEAQFLQQQQDWIQIQYQGLTGWVSSEYVTTNEATVLQTSDTSKEATVTSSANDPNTFTVNVNAVNIRKKPDLTAKNLGLAKIGEHFTVLSRNHNWVEIEYENGKKGWIYSFYGTFTKQKTAQKSTSKSASSSDDNVTIIYNGTNLRGNPTTDSDVVTRANAGDTYPIVGTEGDWYKVAVSGGNTAYVADWLVTENGGSSNVVQKKSTASRKKGTLKGLTIVLDAGHGGNDRGTTGARGTDEKDVNILTAELLKSKLQAAGADVVMTRESDVYVDLRKRVSISHQVDADAFLSIHYDAVEDSSVSGFTTYYTNSYQKELAEYVHAGMSKKVSLPDRGPRFGDYLVLRENRQNAILLELGYLSNPSEERAIVTDYYREQATLGIYQGLLNYFDAQLAK